MITFSITSTCVPFLCMCMSLINFGRHVVFCVNDIPNEKLPTQLVALIVIIIQFLWIYVLTGFHYIFVSVLSADIYNSI
jgi:hypothetical protein